MGLGGERRGAAWLLRSGEVPASMAERFILSGYRCPGATWGQCVASAFQATNETGNFWTHFVALFVFAFHFGQQLGGEGAGGGRRRRRQERAWWWWGEPFYYPLWSYFVGVVGLLAASCMAHLFNARSLLMREICFYIDYGTISAYTVGASLAYIHYIHPPGGPAPLSPGPANLSSSSGPWPRGGGGGWLEALYVPAACLLAVLCTLACCSSRHQWPRHRYLIRTLVFLLPFVVVSMPVFRKLWRSGGGHGTTGRFFFRHCLWLLASGLFNVSKIPERFGPGRFDIWGHSHQWFHCCTFMSILDELHMIAGELRALEPLRPPTAPTFRDTFGVMLLLFLLLAAIVGWFGVRAYGRQQQQHRQWKKEDGDRPPTQPTLPPEEAHTRRTD